jgi:hypothetical protein
MNRDLLVPCFNPICEAMTLVRVYGPTHTEPGFESTDVCEDCGEPLDFEQADHEIDYYDPAL